MSTTTEHDARLNSRLSREIKNRVERAAVSGRSVSDFAVSALARTADDVLERHRTIMLGPDSGWRQRQGRRGMYPAGLFVP